MERDALYARIEQRVDAMMRLGLLEETQRLYDAGYTSTLPALQGLGYKQLLRYFDGQMTLDEAVDDIKRETRRFSKRQITWFKRDHSSMDKEYLVRVQYGDVATNVQAVFPAQQLARLCHGLSLDGQALKPARVEWQNPEQLRFVLTEGKKRQIRRMCELVGLRVVGLKRIRIGRVTLGNLPVGQWRYLGPHEQF